MFKAANQSRVSYSEEQIEDSIITLDHPGRLRLTTDYSVRNGYFSRPRWRQIPSGELVITKNSGSCDPDPISETAVTYEKGQAWFIEVGKMSEGDFVLRTTFSKGTDWKNIWDPSYKIEEPQNFMSSVAQLLTEFQALRSVRKIVNKDDQEVLRDFGRFIEARMQVASHNGYRTFEHQPATVIHIVPADYDLLKLPFNWVDPPSWARPSEQETYGKQRHRVELDPNTNTAIPSYFFQIDEIGRVPSSTAGRTALGSHHIVVRPRENEEGELHADIVLVMPADLRNVQPVPEWLEEMVRGEGELGERWSAAVDRRLQAFKTYQTHVSTGELLPEEQIVRDSHWQFDPTKYKFETLRAFLPSVLKHELDQIQSVISVRSDMAPSSFPQISVLGGTTNYDLKEIERTGLFKAYNLFGPSIHASKFVSAVEAAEKDRSSQESPKSRPADNVKRFEETNEEAAERLWGSPPAYDGPVGTPPSVPAYTEYLFGSQNLNDTPEGTAFQQTSVAETAMAGMLNAALSPQSGVQRSRSRSPWRRLLCYHDTE